MKKAKNLLVPFHALCNGQTLDQRKINIQIINWIKNYSEMSTVSFAVSRDDRRSFLFISFWLWWVSSSQPQVGVWSARLWGRESIITSYLRVPPFPQLKIIRSQAGGTVVIRDLVVLAWIFYLPSQRKPSLAFTIYISCLRKRMRTSLRS